MSRLLEYIPKTPDEVAEAKQLIRNLKREDEIKNIEARSFFDSLRPEIRAFAESMEMTMRKHDPKKGDSYKTCSIAFLVDKLDEEFEEFVDATNEMGSKRHSVTAAVASECVDVANVAMMLYNRQNKPEAE